MLWLLPGAPFFFAAAASAQGFRLGRWEGSLESRTEYDHQDSRTAGAAGFTTDDFLTSERLSLRNVDAYIFDPRLVTFTLGGTFGLFQEHFSFDGADATRSGTLWGYEAYAGILSEQPYALSLYANRNQDVSSLIFGGRTETIYENRGGTFFAKRLYIPSSLSFRQETLSQETNTGATVARQDQTRNTVTYQGDRGWEDSEGSLRYEFTDLSDHVFPDLSYQSNDVSLYYSIDFDPELTQRSDSNVRFFKRSGLGDLTTLSVDENLRVDYTDRLRANYRYFLLRTETPGGATTVNTGQFTLRHRLYESLTTNFLLAATGQTLPNGKKYTHRGRLDLAYTKRIPWDGRLNVGLTGEMRYDDNRFNVPETFVPQETHTATSPLALAISLGNPFVDVGTIVVTKTAVGPLPAGCVAPPAPPTPLVLGRDYTVRSLGDLTEIVPVPCAGLIPGINPGDTIAVDYRFAVPTSLAYITPSFTANISADYRWIRPYFSLERTNQDLVSGRDGRFLDNVRSDTVGTELRYNAQGIRASLLGEGKTYTSRRVAYDSARSGQFLGIDILPELTLTLNADEAWFQYSQPRKQTRTLSGRASVTYLFGATVYAEAFARLLVLKDTQVPTERTAEAGLRVRWTFRKLEIDPTLQFIDRRRGETDTKDFRAILRVIRRF